MDPNNSTTSRFSFASSCPEGGSRVLPRSASTASIANMVEVMIRDYCGRNAVAITDSKRSTVPVRARRGQAT